MAGPVGPAEDFAGASPKAMIGAFAKRPREPILSIAIVALTMVLLPAASIVVQHALAAGLFYGTAGARHAGERNRSRNETVAMASDLFLFVVLAAVVIGSAAAG